MTMRKIARLRSGIVNLVFQLAITAIFTAVDFLVLRWLRKR
jgi:hypothetical protein